MILAPLLLLASGFASALQTVVAPVAVHPVVPGSAAGAVVSRAASVELGSGMSAVVGPKSVSFTVPASLPARLSVGAPALRVTGPVARAAADGPTPLQEPLPPGQSWSPYADGRLDPRMGTGQEMVHDGPRGRNLVPISSFEPALEPVDWRSSRASLDRRFDGSAVRRDSTPDPVAGAATRGAPSSVSRNSAEAKAPASVVVPAPAAAKSRGLSLPWKIALGVALFLLTPGIALAQAAGAPVVTSVATTLTIMAALRPAAAALGAVAGAVYGMFAARPKDGSEASAGDTLTSVLRYGAIGGASVYMLFDLTTMAFVGPTGAGLQPLSSAVVTAALGRTAFQGKFADHATTSADRIVGAFPAVAAALGISLAVTLLVPPALFTTLAMGAMSVTGVIAAAYSAIFKLGRSPLDGPSRMSKGFVLQALMCGMALAVSTPWLFWPFAAMGAAGFALVLWTMARELLSFLPGRAVHAPEPAPAPPTPPSGPKA